MRVFVRYIVDAVLEIFRQIWYDYKIKELKKEINTLKENVNEKSKEATDAVNSFESEYELYLRKRADLDKQGRDKSGKDS